MVELFAGLIVKSAHKTVINISSRMGSIGENTSGGDYIYRSSKAALNMVTKSLAIDLAGRGITVISFHPGWVQSDMGGPGAAIAPATSVAGMRQVIAGRSEEHTSELQSLMRTSYAVFCLTKKN